MTLTLGSLFDGICGFPLAASRCGIKPVWASEIDKSCHKVTAYHFPDMKQMGDITKLHGDELEPVDIITGGSPCQDLSVAGKQAGLKGERSGLFLEMIRIVNEMRNSTGKPRYVLWENVPGAFSSNKGQDFKAVLEAFLGHEVPMPRRWEPAGMAPGLAWRVLDAQYFGVPQRRRRIFLVRDLDGDRAGEILFEQPGVSGHSSQGGEAGKDVARCVDAGTGRLQGADHDNLIVMDQSHTEAGIRIYNDAIAPTLTDWMASGGGHIPCVMAVSENQRAEVVLSEKMHSLSCAGGKPGRGYPAILSNAVRRLTPTECERLQGYPYGWTDLGISDSARYRMLGNSVAVPVVEWIMRRITP